MGLREIWGPEANRILLVGLTGGIGSGKTEVASELAKLGANVIDADEVARDISLPGTRAYEEIVNEFGDVVLDSSGNIDRESLASLVFGHEDRRRRLNGITHPRIFEEIIQRVRRSAAGTGNGEVPATIVDAALIVDVGASGAFDMLLVVTADEDIRVRRMEKHRGMSEEEARGRVASQVPEAERITRADVVIENNGTLDDLRHRVADAWEEIKKRAGTR